LIDISIENINMGTENSSAENLVRNQVG